MNKYEVYIQQGHPFGMWKDHIGSISYKDLSVATDHSDNYLKVDHDLAMCSYGHTKICCSIWFPWIISA